MNWDDVLRAPAYVINLDRCPKRWETTAARLREAGFTDIRRVRAVDAAADDLGAEWVAHGSPQFNAHDVEFCNTYKGKQGCFLSHAKVLKDASDPFFLVFEDDVLFHPQFAALAPQYWNATPKDFDLLYLGSQLDYYGLKHPIVRLPCFCTNAMAMTAEGAKKIYDFLMTHPRGVSTIDCMLKEHQEDVTFRGAAAAFQWYVWNGGLFPTNTAHMPKDWTKRNSGLVFQDESFGSDVRPW